MCLYALQKVFPRSFFSLTNHLFVTGWRPCHAPCWRLCSNVEEVIHRRWVQDCWFEVDYCYFIHLFSLPACSWALGQEQVGSQPWAQEPSCKTHFSSFQSKAAWCSIEKYEWFGFIPSLECLIHYNDGHTSAALRRGVNSEVNSAFRLNNIGTSRSIDQSGCCPPAQRPDFTLAVYKAMSCNEEAEEQAAVFNWSLLMLNDAMRFRWAHSREMKRNQSH